MRLFVATPQKLVPFLKTALSEKCSGKMVRRLLEANICRVNGRIERFGSAQLQRGDLVELAPSWKSVIESRASIQFTLLYEDADLVLVDKPVGWVCNEENCRRYFGPYLQLVHRLDKDTTGVLALAKSLKIRDELMALFANREVHKEYLALVDGIPKEVEGERESYLVRKRVFEGQTVWGSGTGGLYAATRWRKLAEGKGASLLLCQPLTGRTHQIRVHLAEIGHPILIDRQYAATFRCSVFAPRPLLHALRLQFNTACAEAPLPSDMKDLIHSLDMSPKMGLSTLLAQRLFCGSL